MAKDYNIKLNTPMKITHIIQLITASVAFSVLPSCGDNKPGGSAETDTTENQDIKPYPLDVCVVSGKKLGSMGEPHVFVYKGQQVKMCCDHCMPKFNKAPEKYLAKLKGE